MRPGSNDPGRFPFLRRGLFSRNWGPKKITPADQELAAADLKNNLAEIARNRP